MDKPLFSLAQMNSFAVKAYTSHLKIINHKQELYHLSKIVSGSFYILGEGSNTLFTDSYAPTIIHMVLKGIKVEELDFAYRLTVAAGENWHHLVEFCIKNNINGLENLALIPGSVGAAPVQNIGAYGVEFADFCETVTWFDFDKQHEASLTKDECLFSYRGSIFKQILKGKGIITEVTLLLPKCWRANLSYAGLDKLSSDVDAATVMAKVIELRTNKLPDPQVLPNAGSFFKNPIISQTDFESLLLCYPNIPNYPQRNNTIKIAAAWLIENAGLKGKQFGKVGIHNKQALVLVNYGEGSGQDLLLLAKYVQETVYKKFKIKIEPEVRLVASRGEMTIEEFKNG